MRQNLLFASIFPVILILLASCSILNAEESATHLFHLDKANQATTKSVEELQAAYKKFTDKLEAAKSAAVKKNDIDEVTRIENALKNEPFDSEFSTFAAKTAYKSLVFQIKSEIKDFQHSLESGIKEALAAGDTEDAANMKSISEKLDEILKAEAGDESRTKFTVDANKDWQETDIQVKQGTTVTLESSGKWSAGARKKESKDKWEYIYGDADTYNLQASINEKVIGRGGITWNFVSPADGILRLRMLPVRNRARLGDAQGSLSVKITLTTESSAKDIYHAIASILATSIPDNTSNESQQTSTGNASTVQHGSSSGFQIFSNKDWQDTGITLTKGQLVHVACEGKWSPGERATGKYANMGPIFGTVDQFRMQARIGENNKLPITTSNCSFVAPIDGNLFLRRQPVNESNWKGPASGSVTVQITIENIPTK